MKTTKFWSLLALCFCLAGAVTLTACGDDDEGNTPGANIDSPIVGTWEMSSEYEEEDYYSKHVSFYTFEKDGRFSQGFTYYSARDVEHERMLNSGTYTVDGNVLKLTYTKAQFWFEGQEQTGDNDSRFESYSEEMEFVIRDNQLFFVHSHQGQGYEDGPYIRK